MEYYIFRTFYFMMLQMSFL